MVNETEKRKSEKSSRRRKVITWCRRILLVGLLLFAANLVVRTIYRRANEKEVRDFYASVGATSASNLLRTNKTDDLSENGWHLFMASLGCLSTSTRDLLANVSLGDSAEKMPSLGDAVEAELDEGHKLLGKSREKLRCASVYRAESTSYLRLLTDYSRAAVLSARHHREQGDFDKARERLVDVFHLLRNSEGQPVLIGYFVGSAILRKLEGEIGLGIGDFPTDDLRLYEKLLGEIDRTRAFRLAMIGEIFFEIGALEKLNNTTSWSIGFYSLFIHELDRSYCLERIIPLALNSTSSSTKAKLSEPIPLPEFMVPVSTITSAVLFQVLKDHEGAVLDFEIIQEALSRELRRRLGEDFAYPPASKNIVLKKTKTGVRVQRKNSIDSSLAIDINR